MEQQEIAPVLQTLRNLTLWAIDVAEFDFSRLSATQLHQRPENGGWSISECLQHLCFYGDFYLPEMRKQMAKNPKKPTPQYKSSWLGKKFIHSMYIKPDGSVNKMSSPKKANPKYIKVEDNILEIFIAQQKDYLKILDEAALTSLGEVKVGISIATWLKVPLGDALQFTILHNHRHMHQALGVFKTF